MYTNDFDVQNIAIDALMCIMQRRMFEYSQLKKKLENVKRWRNMNSGEIGGAFKYRNSARVHTAQAEDEIKRIMTQAEMEENENGL